jgi:integrase
MLINYPKVKADSEGRIFVLFFQNNKRYRIFNGSKINSKIHPNRYPISERIAMGKILASEVYAFLMSGLTIQQAKVSELITPNMSDKDYLYIALKNKLKGSYTKKYNNQLTFIYKKLINRLRNDKLQSAHIESILNVYTSETSYNTYRRRLCTLINEAIKVGMSSNSMEGIKSKRTKATLHKPYKNIGLIIDNVRAYNANLHLCVLITYGCLLRPHREVRELTWNDFSDDLTFIHLSGKRNKSGRNRIVPVPSYIRDVLVKGEPHHNIFSNKPQPLNQDYFKTLWSRFKRQSNVLEQGQTLYSFRHSGAIEIFKRTGSITKLQKAMGHSSINVSLTYLRGLEIAELKESDMPMVV